MDSPGQSSQDQSPVSPRTAATPTVPRLVTGSLTVGDTSLITRGEQPASKGVPAAAVPFLTSSLWSRRLGKVSVGEVKRQSRHTGTFCRLRSLSLACKACLRLCPLPPEWNRTAAVSFDARDGWLVGRFHGLTEHDQVDDNDDDNNGDNRWADGRRFKDRTAARSRRQLLPIVVVVAVVVHDSRKVDHNKLLALPESLPVMSVDHSGALAARD
ncbi:hypothetical protein CKAH01_10113 [Colletotrichum kahawae]|uniref:Uncharacterized protein n=1 Tax=Colletotrichum kahawae TaxID=34407 RepID=A0AAE0CY17_COLKA|nr:hypothetical protein CKAH01_10113 [Colletotrichum kahawae]